MTSAIRQDETSSGDLSAFFQSLARSMGFAVMLIGIVSLAGWFLGIPWLTRSPTTGLIIKTNTAIGLLALGLGLALLSPKEASRWALFAGCLCAMLALIIGSITLFEIVTSIDVGIDQLLFRETVPSLATSSPNRMGPPAAVALAFGGLALLPLRSPRLTLIRLVHALAMLVLIAGLLPLCGHLYGVISLYAIANWTNTALQTAIAMVLFAVGLLCVRADVGLMAIVSAPDPAGATVRRLLVPVILLPLILGSIHLSAANYEAWNTAVATLLFTLLGMIVLAAIVVLHARALRTAERRRSAAETQLRERQVQLDSALRAAVARTWNWDLQRGSVALSGKSSADGPQKPVNEMPFATWLSGVLVEDQALVEREAGKCRSGQPDLDVEFRMAGAGGEIHWFHLHGRCLGHEQVMGVMQDVTERKWREMRLRDSADRIQVLYEATQSLLQQDDVQKMVSAICARLLPHIECELFINHLVQGEELRLVASQGISDAERSRLGCIPLGEAIGGAVAREGTRVIAEDIQQVPSPSAEATAMPGLQAYACHAIIGRGRILGTLGFGSRIHRRFKLDDLTLMQTVANHVAVALQRSSDARPAIDELARQAGQPAPLNLCAPFLTNAGPSV